MKKAERKLQLPASLSILRFEPLPFQGAAQRIERPKLHRFDRANRFAQHLGSLFQAVTFYEAQDDHLLLLVRQASQCGLYLVSVVRRHQRAIQVLFNTQFDIVNVVMGPGTSRPAIIIDESRVGNSVQPGQQRRRTIFVRGQTFKRVREYICRQIFRRRLHVDAIEDVAVNAVYIGIVQLGKRLGIAALSKAYECLFALTLHVGPLIAADHNSES
jgi:hypothetical protein